MKLKPEIFGTTFGNIATAFFMLVIVSGIMIAVPYDVTHPYLSLGKTVLLNPFGSFVRNMHFWSSQWFLVFSLIHLYFKFKNNKTINTKPLLWFRLSAGVLVIFLAMLTGFILKGDADSTHARVILENLTEKIPFAGKPLAHTLLGKQGDYLLVYVHHIATFTVFLAVIILEHSRKIWPGTSDFVFSSLFVFVFSWFFTAPLHDTLGGTVKGPWYFVGFQEILHLLSLPGLSLVAVFLVLFLVWLIPFTGKRKSFLIRRVLLIIAVIYFVFTLSGLFFRGENWRWITPFDKDYNYEVLSNFRTSKVDFSPEFSITKAYETPQIRGQYESCLFCHDKEEGFVKSHNPQVVGCYACHGGNPFATAKKDAHSGMRLLPGNLNDAKHSCGTTSCHPSITGRINGGLMATLNGMISVDRYVFDEQKSPDLPADVHSLGNSASDVHLKTLCVRCHLGNPKTKTGAITEKSRGGGCLACHLNYKRDKKEYPAYHPQLSLTVTDNHCSGCHSRSGRISTNYEGWHETLLNPQDVTDTTAYRIVEGYRVFERKEDDIHHKLGMSCIDCHNSYELMGDGNHYVHEEQQEDVQCVDCHLKTEGSAKNAGNKLDDESAKIAALRYGNITGLNFLYTSKHKHPLINTRRNGDTILLLGKINGKRYVIKKVPEKCSKDKVHDNVTCSACHSAWAPSCIGCHNSYDPSEPSYDMIKNREITGGWVEFTGEYNAHLPALGVRTVNGKNEIIPVVPGMILTIDKKSYTKNRRDSLIFKRLFAPAAPHTTAKKGRNCKSCHNNPLALGYGAGKLEYKIAGKKGYWNFMPFYKNSPADGLPEDAWTGFLKERDGVVSTRTNVKPFGTARQKRILTVGACLTCHDENSKVMQKSLVNFDEVLKNRKEKCILPFR